MLSMNSSTLRRLASDHASLRRATPPNYLFPPNADSSSLPDELTQLTILVTGAQGTAYSQGLWRLHLSMPDDYPKSPPKATFRTRIYHPNVEESTGAVCLDTLKKDWHSKLTLRDILITISCLLIHPNPDSALNSAAGALLQDDYDAFAKQARLMTSIHAPIPPHLRHAVLEAKRRGEEDEPGQQSEATDQPATSRAVSSTSSLTMKKQGVSIANGAHQESGTRPSSSTQAITDPSRDDEEGDDTKENDPSHSPLPVYGSYEPMRKNILGKRPLSELPTPVDPEATDANLLREKIPQTGPDEEIPTGQLQTTDHNQSSEPAKKSPKLDISARSFNTYGKVRQEDCPRLTRGEKAVISSEVDLGEDKENIENAQKTTSEGVANATVQQSVNQASESSRPTLRKVSNVGSSRTKGQARVGIRRL